MKKSVLAVASIASILAFNVNAKEGLTPYAGARLGYQLYDKVDADDGNFSFPTFGVAAGVRYGITDELYVGGELGLNYGKKGIKDEYGKFSVSSLYNADVNVGYNLTKEFSLFAIVGVNDYKVKITGDEEGKFSKSKVALEYGLGASYLVSDQIEVSLALKHSEPKFGDEDSKLKYNNFVLGANYLF
jgi:opacity protein-like surface antigen